MSADELKARGNAAFASKDYPLAIDLFTQALALTPSAHVLFSNRSAAHAALKDYPAALVDADRCIELDPSFVKGYGRKGSALHGLKKFEESIEVFQEGLKKEPGNALLKKGLAEVEAAADKEDAGGMGKMFQDPAMFSKLAANPKTAPYLSDPAFVNQLKAMQNGTGPPAFNFQDPRMIQVFGALMGVNLDSFERPEGSGFDPKDPQASAPAPSSASASEEKPAPKAKAEEAKVVAEEEEPEAMEVDQEAEDKVAAEEAKKKGNEAYRARRFDEAVESYEKAWSLSPKDISYLTNLAAVFFEQGEFDKAIETCEKAVEAGRDLRADYKMVAKAFGRMGSAYQKKNDLDSAIKYYNKALTEHRTADVLEKLRVAEKTKKDNDVAAYLSPEKAEEARNEGNDLFKKSDFPGAVKAYSEAIKRLPSDPRAYNNRAAAYTKLAALPEALKDADAAIALDKTFVKAHIRKSLVLFGMREYSKALQACGTATDADVDRKHTREIEQQVQKCLAETEKERAGESEEATLQRAMRDPEVAQIMSDPVMRQILEQGQNDPRALQEHMKSPMIKAKIQKLMAAGIIRTR